MIDYLISVFYEPITDNGVSLYNITVFLIILILGYLIGTIISRLIKRKLPDKMSINDKQAVGKVITLLIFFIAFVSALPNLNIDLSGIFVVGGLFALVFGIACQSVFSNAVSGVILFIERPIKIGDDIKIGGSEGTVIDIQVLSTIIKTFDGIYVRIPNQTMFTADIINYVVNVARRFEYVIGIRYSDDADLALKVIERVISEHPFALKNPAPSIFVSELGDNSVNITIKIWAPSTVWLGVKYELLLKIRQELLAEGIDVPFPQRTLSFADDVKDKVVLLNPTDVSVSGRASDSTK
ncbi:MAG: mechanosensitive ion channel family protein [Methanomicrobium sp.]|nr:mechanosensitive ion channel family protein [Methanomicrobium sp.]